MPAVNLRPWEGGNGWLDLTQQRNTLSSKPHESCPKEAWKMYGLCQRVSAAVDGWLCSAAVPPGWKDRQ